MLSTLLVVTLARDADPKAVGDTLDVLPDLLVELGINPDVLSALFETPSAIGSSTQLLGFHLQSHSSSPLQYRQCPSFPHTTLK